MKAYQIFQLLNAGASGASGPLVLPWTHRQIFQNFKNFQLRRKSQRKICLLKQEGPEGPGALT